MKYRKIIRLMMIGIAACTLLAACGFSKSTDRIETDASSGQLSQNASVDEDIRSPECGTVITENNSTVAEETSVRSGEDTSAEEAVETEQHEESTEQSVSETSAVSQKTAETVTEMSAAPGMAYATTTTEYEAAAKATTSAPAVTAASTTAKATTSAPTTTTAAPTTTTAEPTTTTAAPTTTTAAPTTTTAAPTTTTAEPTTTTAAPTTTTSAPTTTTAAPTTITSAPTTTTEAPTTTADNTAYYQKLISQEFEVENQERIANGLPAFHYNSDAQYIADRRAQQIVTDFSHTKFSTEVWGDESERAIVCNWTAGENIACGYPTAAAVHQGWMNSQGHRENILNESFTSITIGVYSVNGYLYWVQIFGDK